MTPSQVRVRFAPSPTGYLHVGGARTALFNWLWARKRGGQFLLRIEDTDRQRSSPEHTQVILDGLTWLGLDWDGDVAFQGAGIERHRALAERLLQGDHAYVDEGAVRLRMPAETIVWHDAVLGEIAVPAVDLRDWVILRSDHTPTYNFSVVADDIEMAVTLVLRGSDHVSNTPKQIAVYRALGVDPPAFGHVPMIHGPDGKKLSKRHGATAVREYRHEGILPAAMRNFLALLGWNPKNERELFFATGDLVEAFELKDIQKKAAIFDPQKLLWMNGQHLSVTAPEELVPLIEPELRNVYELDPQQLDRDQLLKAIGVVRARSRTTKDIARQVAVRLDGSFVECVPKAAKTIANDASGYRAALEAVVNHLEGLAPEAWEVDVLDRELRELAEARGLRLGQVMQPVRIALTGDTVSEPVNELLWVVGKERALRRLRAAQDWGGATE